MSVKERAKHILVELKGHAPFTLFGALLGIGFMLVFRKISGDSRHTLFAIFHPAHVVLSAIVAASMFRLHAAKKKFLLVLAVGYFASIGVATLSDIIIPHIGMELLGLNIPKHSQLHEREATETDEHDEHGLHLGFIEEWYIVNPAALLGIFIAYFLPRTKFPHAGHILISTWASSSYLLMTMQSEMTIAAVAGILVTLFIATWLPCCVGDIVFPLLLVKSDIALAGCCPDHARHSHPHSHDQAEDSQ
ncbi:MAG TPA: hypothetical protein VMY06_10985 [Sedimentisphaerales bacterium]|nr:hypothetical protein [Sedimentisphaerales bacterium]